jgi:lantibiotic biosynthesis protein
MKFKNRSARSGLEPRSVRADWKSVLTGELATTAVHAARDVSLRLKTPEQVEAAAAAALAQTAYPRTTHWFPYTIAQGYAGLALLWGYLDSCFVDEGWDVTGREHLELAVRGAEIDQELPVGLFSGLSGLAFAAWQLSRQGTRYRRLLARLDEAICARAIVMADGLGAQHGGVTVDEFDVISGLSGVGVYLLCRRDQPGPAAALESVIHSLADLAADENGVPRWNTPARLFWDEGLKETYPDGNLNCGLAHGIPGPLAFLSLALEAGSAVAGLPEAVARMADWVCANRCDDSWGINWTTAVPLEPAVGSEAGALRPGSAQSAPDGPSRSAWCYGSPGVSRALWLAGVALDRDDYRSLAISAMEAVFRRPVTIRRIDSPTFCHGVAGLLAIALRFANETGLPVFIDESRKLVQQILESYRPDSLLGFRSLEVGDREVDQPGLLDGIPSVALVLLAAATGVEPTWDRLFLLS